MSKAPKDFITTVKYGQIFFDNALTSKYKEHSHSTTYCLNH